MKNIRLKIATLACIIFFTFSCKKDPILPTSMVLDPSSLLSYVGKADTIKPIVSPPNASANITWSSSNVAIANVSPLGIVTGIAAGTAVITATTDNNISATCTVTVEKWTNYTTANSGLAGKEVYALEIDKQGNLWVGTNAGVSKFDGNTWVTYNTSNSGLTDNMVRDIAIDAKGIKWFVVGEIGVINAFDDHNWQTYATNPNSVYSVSCVAIDPNDNKWFGTYYKGLYKFDGTNWTYYNYDNPSNEFIVNTSYKDGLGNMWFGFLLSGKIWKYDGIAWKTFLTKDIPYGGHSVYAISSDVQGNLWFGFAIQGSSISKFDGSSWTTYVHDYSLGTRQDVPPLVLGVKSIAVDTRNNKWFGTAGSGIVKFNNAGWITYDSANSGLPSNYIDASAIDTEGNIWFGFYNGGGIAKLHARN